MIGKSYIKYLLTALMLFPQLSAFSQSGGAGRLYEINVAVPEKKIYSDHLQMGGENAKGDRIAVNNFYISVNDKPIIPVTGEFHFSRYPEQYWDESIKKMKAGGINMIATYIFWNMHEEEEGKFKWNGSRNVRKFVELCAKNDMPVVMRIGPFCHGEIRNGGLPDWLLSKPLTIRSNNPDYLFYAERLYQEIGRQLQGLYFKDDGPILAVQLENEYQHSAAPWGLTYPGQPYDFTSADRDQAFTLEGVGISNETNPYAELGNEHMRVLKSLAQKAGLVVPIYTATGWGNAATIPNETIPVTAAYPYPTWTRKKDISPFYLYKDMHKNPDYAPVRYKPEDYPAFAAELGGGIMSTYARRPVVPAKSMDALINRCLGSGANGIGYYMYHGGSTPRGAYYFFNDEAYGYPKISYDFQAPIGEYGQLRPSFHRLKLLHCFINAFSSELAPMATVLPETNAGIKPVNIQDLRYAARAKNGFGFLFVNNFQDDTTMTDKSDIRIRIKTGDGEVLLPEGKGFSIKSGENAIFPFNLDLNGVRLNYATAQLLTKNDDPTNPYFVFFVPEGVVPEFSIAKSPGVTIQKGTQAKIEQNSNRWLVQCYASGVSEFTVRADNGTKTKVLVIDKAFALKSWTATIHGKQHLIFTDAAVLPNNNALEFLSRGSNKYDFFVYPKLNFAPGIDAGKVTVAKKHPVLSHFAVSVPEATLSFSTEKVSDKRLVINLEGGMPAQLNDVFLHINYLGDTGMGFIDGELVADEFFKGLPWEIGLKQFLDKPEAKEMNFYFRPIYKDATFLVDLDPASLPDFSKTPTITTINSTTFIPEYKSVVTFGK